MEADKILVGVLSDTHISSSNEISNALESALAEFNNFHIDYLFHLGDFTNVGVYQILIDKYGEDRVIAVHGNMDAMDSQLQKILPAKKEIILMNHRILLLHGWGAPINMIGRIKSRFDLSQYDLIVFGHTHRHLITQRGKKWFFNPGACKNRGSFGLLELTKDEINPRIIQL
ncbi:MAG: YfcE family phosphodiesterase [Candidatus Lokiarchaeota archaeon]|nr:YfcE family phosphodiesterase [Candidatus Harpocratesius repetitus]